MARTWFVRGPGGYTPRGFTATACSLRAWLSQTQLAPPQLAACGHGFHRSVQALASMFYHALSMGSCSQFCLILHPHRVVVPFPPTFASPWQNSFVQIYGEQLCSRQNLGPPLKNNPKTTKIWGWGHLMVQIHPPPGSLRFPMNESACVLEYFHLIGLPHIGGSSQSPLQRTSDWDLVQYSTGLCVCPRVLV